MKKKILFLSWLLSIMVLSVSTQAGIGTYVTSSGYILSWDKKTVILFSRGHQINVPRKAFGGMRLKKGQYVSSLTYKKADVPGFKKFTFQRSKAVPRAPASTYKKK